MSIGSIFTLAEAQKITGVSRHLVTFLINDREIPIRVVGMAKVIDEDGLNLLKRAIAEYRAKAEPATASA